MKDKPAAIRIEINTALMLSGQEEWEIANILRGIALTVGQSLYMMKDRQVPLQDSKGHDVGSVTVV